MNVWLQNLIVAIIVVAAASWVVWNVVLPRRLRNRLAGRLDTAAACGAYCNCGDKGTDSKGANHAAPPCAPPPRR